MLGLLDIPLSLSKKCSLIIWRGVTMMDRRWWWVRLASDTVNEFSVIPHPTCVQSFASYMYIISLARRMTQNSLTRLASSFIHIYTPQLCAYTRALVYTTYTIAAAAIRERLPWCVCVCVRLFSHLLAAAATYTYSKEGMRKLQSKQRGRGEMRERESVQRSVVPSIHNDRLPCINQTNNLFALPFK